MANIKEVKLMKDGAMVTPVVLIDSVKNSDGRNYKDVVYSKAEIKNIFSNMVADYEFRFTNSKIDGTILKSTFPYGDIFNRYSAKYLYEDSFDGYDNDKLETVTIQDYEFKCLCFKVNDETYISSFPYSRDINVEKTISNVVAGYDLTYKISGTLSIQDPFSSGISFSPVLTVKLVPNGFDTMLVDASGNKISATRKLSDSFEASCDILDRIAIVIDFGKFTFSGGDVYTGLLQYHTYMSRFLEEYVVFLTPDVEQTYDMEVAEYDYEYAVGMQCISHRISVTYTK